MKSSGDRQPIPILFVLPNFKAGGAERVVLTLLSLLDRTRFAPELVVFDGRGEFTDLVPPDLKLHNLGVTRLRSAFLPLLQLIRKRRPSLVFASHNYVSLALLAGRVLLPAGLKIVVRESTTPSKSLPDAKHSRLLHWGYAALIRHADRLICLNREVQNDFCRLYGVEPRRMVLLPNPVAASSLRKSAEKPFRDPGSGRRLVAAGRLIRAKGYDNLLRVLAETSEDIFLTIYGDGPEEQSLKGLCSKLQLDERVRFAGFEKQLGPAFAGADAVIMSSRWEGFPNVVLEALACGAPVISTRTAGGVADLTDVLTDDALKLTSSEQELAQAIGKVERSDHTDLRPSLLPPQFEDKNVARLFADTLEQALH